MSSVAFDTFKFVDRLERAGLNREQAAAIVEAQKDAFAQALDSTLTTKNDVAGIDAKIDLLRAENTHTRWMIGALIALAAANFAKQYF